MTAPIPDPEHPDRRAIDPRDGALMGGVYIAPVGTSLDDRQAWSHIGYAHNPLARPAAR